MDNEATIRLAELDERIARIREELRELSDRGAATSGPAGEERIAEMIADKEARLAELLQARG